VRERRVFVVFEYAHVIQTGEAALGSKEIYMTRETMDDAMREREREARLVPW